MRKKESDKAKKAHSLLGYHDHLKKYGKRLANKAIRRKTKEGIKKDERAEQWGNRNA